MTNLICMFSDKSSLLKDLLSISNNAVILDNRILVFLNINNTLQCYCIYNTSTNNNLKNSIKIHRYKKTGTFYTINVINYFKDKNLSIIWDQYQNSIILFNKNKDKTLRHIKLKLIKVKKIV